MENQAQTKSSHKGKAREWLAVLGAPLLWLAELNAEYWLVPAACEGGRTTLLTVTGVTFFALTVAIAFVAWRNWKQAGRSWPSSTAEDIPTERSRFLAVLGLMACGLFGLFILGDILPTLLIHPCLE